MGHEKRWVCQGRNSGMAGIKRICYKKGGGKVKKMDLKPCPHCGGIKLRIDDFGFFVTSSMREKPESYWIVCLSCFASGGSGKDKKEAAVNWNRRVP
jgi:Lar family restriction alleviation protein